MEEVITIGSTVRVLAAGEFNHQVVKVLDVDRKEVYTRAGPKVRTWYKLAVKWGETPRPSWFEDFEVEKVHEQGGSPHG